MDNANLVLGAWDEPALRPLDGDLRAIMTVLPVPTGFPYAAA